MCTYYFIVSKPGHSTTQEQNVYINQTPRAKKVDINKACREELKALPAIDDKKADLIIKNRPFKNVYEIKSIEGIGTETIKKAVPFMFCGEVGKW